MGGGGRRERKLDGDREDEKVPRPRGARLPLVRRDFEFRVPNRQASGITRGSVHLQGLCLHAAPPLQPAAPRLPAGRPAGEESPTPSGVPSSVRPRPGPLSGPVWAPHTSNASRRGQRCSCGWGDPEPLMRPQGKRRRRLENVLPIPHPFLLTRPRARVPLTTGS